MKKATFLVCIILLAQAATSQVCVDTIPVSTPDSRFVVNGDEVKDSETGLIWQRCSLGLTESECTDGSASTYTWQQALEAAKTERADTGQAWRLPNLNELESIVEEKCYAPTMNLVIFPKTISRYYWSASPHASSSNNAWYFHFYYGYSGNSLRSSEYYVRLVREGQ